MWIIIFNLLYLFNIITPLSSLSLQKFQSTYFFILCTNQNFVIIILVCDKITISWTHSHNGNIFQYCSRKLPCNYMHHPLSHEYPQWNNGVIHTVGVCTSRHCRKQYVQEIVQLKPLWNLFECSDISVSQCQKWRCHTW